MKIAKCVVSAAFVTFTATAAVPSSGAEPVDYVNLFVGTAATGNTYPGPVWPLGMV